MLSLPQFLGGSKCSLPVTITKGTNWYVWGSSILGKIYGQESGSRQGFSILSL